MGSSEEYLLRWNDFESNIATAFRGLRGDDEFSDINLICATSSGQTPENLVHQTLKAHKVILSTCSPYFRGLLRHLKGSETPLQIPSIVMRGVNIHHMASILDFMYYGEVNISQAELDTFLALAEELQVKGLTQKKGGHKDASQNDGHQPPPKRRKVSPAASVSTPVTPKEDNGTIKEERDEMQEAEADVEDVEDVKNEEQYYDYDDQADYSGAGEDPGEGTSNFGNDRKDQLSGMDDQEYKESVRKLIVPVEVSGRRQFRCKVCGDTRKDTTSSFAHIERFHLKVNRYQCSYCDAVFSSNATMKVHLSRNHKEQKVFNMIYGPVS